MSDQSPTLSPPSSSNAISTGTGDAAPTASLGSSVQMIGATGTWSNNSRVSGLWGINQNRNSWAYVTGVGWKKLANNSDTAIVALTVLAANAKQSQGNFNYREESDGMIHEVYAW